MEYYVALKMLSFSGKIPSKIYKWKNKLQNYVSGVVFFLSGKKLINQNNSDYL